MGRIPDHLVRLAVRALENRWVTIGAKPDSKRPGKKKGGTPVELDGEGKITKGPAALTGKRPSELSQSHLFSGQDHKSQRKMFAEPGDPPPPPAIEETPKAPPPAAKKEPKPRAKKPQSMSLMAVIRREGGISSGDFEHADFKEFGLLGALNKKGLSLDDMAATLVRQGHMTVPMGKSSPSDHLLQLLKKKTNSLLAADTAEYDKDYEAYMQAREEAQADGHEEGQLEEVRGRGEEAGGNEGKDRLFDEIFGGDGSGGEEAGRDEPGDLAGDSAEPASGVDTSFDFGPAAAPKVEEKPKAAKPRKPKQKKDWEDRQEEKHQKALADIKAADAEKAAIATKARELLAKVSDPGQKAQLQKLIDQAEGKAEDAKPEEPAAPPPAIEPKPTKKEDHEMTSAEYLRNGRANFGDMVLTPYGKLGIMSGGGTMGSNRVKVKGVWHDRDDLKLIRRPDKDVNQNLSGEWKAKQKADLAQIDKDHGVTLHKKSMVDSAKKRLQAGTMTQDQYDKFVGTGFYKMTDAEMAQAEKAQAEIDAIKDRPLEFEQSVHSLRVANALATGKDVPANVLAEYPDLAKKYGKDKAQPAPPPATNLFGQPEPTKPQPATTQGLFGEQVPVEDPKVKPRETVADQAEKGLDWLYQKQDQKTDGTGEMFGGLFSPGRTSGATEPEAGPVTPPAVDKPAHEMTKAEFVAQAPTDKAKQYMDTSGMHWRKVQQALDAGQNVPAEVLADYPGIKKTEPQQGPSAKEITAKFQAETDARRAQGKQDEANARVRDVEDYKQSRQAAINAGQDVEDGDEKQMRRMIRQNEKDKAKALRTIANYGPDAEAQAFADSMDKENNRLKAKLPKSAEPVAPPAVEPSGPVSSKGKMDAAQRRNLVQLNPIQGPSGAKLVGYNWEFDREHYVDQRGEDRERKVSAWDRAEKAGMTNRDIVHMFTVEGPDGKQQNVSLETAAKMLGFDGGSDQFKAKFKSATSAAKTMARLQMEKAQVEQAAASRAKDMAELKQQAPAMDDGQTEEVPNFLGNRLGLRLKGTQSAVAFGGDGGRTKDEARKILQDSWIKDELKKRGHNPYSAPSVGDIDRRILRAKNKLDELTKQQGPEAPKPEAGPAAQPTVEPSPPATAPKSQSFDDYRQANGVKGYTVDHSMLSPSGKVSGRSANAAQARVDKQFSDYSQAEKEYQAKVDAGEIVDPKGKYQKPDQAKANKGEADLLRNKAKQFRTIAASGMQTRKLTKQAEELEKQANELDPVAKAEAGPVAPPKVEAPKANVIGKGSTGEVVKIGNEVHKNAKGPEGRIYKELSGVDGIAKGRQEGDKIVTPHFKNTLSQDDVPKGNRQSFGPVVKKNLSRIVGAVNALSEKGYDYNDPLQIGFDNDRSAHLFDFSNAQKSNTAIQDNLSHLGTFLSEFGLPRHGDAVSKIAHLYDYLNNQDTRDFDSDSQESKDATKILSQLGGQVPKFAYYTFNARAVPNVAQTEKEPGPNSAKLVFSTKPLNKNFMDTWEIMPAIHKDTTPESRTLSTIRQQLREAFRQCP